MFQVVYNYDPNLSYEKHHMGRLCKCTERGTQKFKCANKAVNFWLECTFPETSLEEIMPAKKYNKTTENIKEFIDLTSND